MSSQPGAGTRRAAARRRNEKSLASSYGKFPCSLRADAMSTRARASAPPCYSPPSRRSVDGSPRSAAPQSPSSQALSLETHSPRNSRQPAAFSLITNRSCKPLSGRYYREHSDGVDRRFSRGRQGPRTPGDFDCFIPRCPRGFQTTKNCRSSWFRRRLDSRRPRAPLKSGSAINSRPQR